MSNKVFFTLLILLFCLNPYISVLAQKADTADVVRTFAGTVTVTTKGLSTFPNLTLGKPASVFDFTMGGEKIRFDPTLRFSLEGKPWTFIFWLRYKIMENERLQLRIGAHPAYSFKTVQVSEGGVSKDMLRVYQYLAGEISPVFFITERISAGPHYIYSRGVDKDAVRNSNFISFRMNLSGMNLTDKLFMRLLAQTYYLKMDANDGFYVNTNLSLIRRNFPLSVSSTVNKTIESTIPGNDFLWNLNLTYSY